MVKIKKMTNLYRDEFETVFGVKKNIQTLRNKVLDLAIQGKLVEQDPNDEPAGELLVRIQSEKEKLIKEKAIKKERPFPEIETDEMPYVVPENWTWVRLGNVTNYAIAPSIKPDEISEDTWVLDLEDIESKSSKILNIKDNGIKMVKSNKSVFRKGQVLYSKLRPYLLKVLVAPADGVCTSEIVPFNGYGGINSDYIVAYLKSDYADKAVNSMTYGMKMPRLGTTQAKNLLFPLPPIEEQNRISSKVKELMKEIDKLEEHLEQKEKLEDLILKAFVNSLSNSRNEEELKKNLSLVIKNFEEVFKTPESLKAFRDVILQLAIQGKLLPQNQNDEPAATLMNSIKENKKQLTKDKKIKKEKDLPAIREEEKSYRIPTNWQWVRLGEIGDWGAGATPQRANPDYWIGGTVPWLKTGELNNSYVTTSEEFITKKALEETSVRLNKPGDILIAMYGATIGKLGILDFEATTNQACCACTSFRGIYNIFLFYLLMSNKQNFINSGEGGAQPNISKTKIVNTVVPLPPYEEQKRIVAKIESLFAVVDQLEEEMKRRERIVEAMAVI